MPSRILHDSARTSPTLDQLSLPALAMFPNLMLVVDDFGFFNADPRVLLANCFPMRLDRISQADIEGWRDEMVSAGLIALYRHEDHVFGYFVKWSKYSKPHNTSKRKFPEPNGNSPFTPIQKKSRKSTQGSSGFTRSHSGSLDLTRAHSVSPSEGEVEGEGTTSSSAPEAPEAAEVSTAPELHARARLGWGTPEALVDLYHELIPPGHPRVTLPLSDARVGKARTYLKQWPDRDFWVKAFGMVSQSSLLQGKAASPGHSHFKANFDWFQQRGSKDGIENCLKAFEGKYLDKTPAGPGTEPPLTWGCAACGKSHSTGRELKGVCQKAEEEAAAAALRATRSNIIPMTDHRKESA